jgi:hypothetical protein
MLYDNIILNAVYLNIESNTFKMHYLLEEFNILTSFIFIGCRIQRRQVPLRRQQPRKDGRRNRRIRQSSRRQENRSAARISHHRTGE